MSAFRYSSQEAANIRAAETRARQQSALNSSIALRLAQADVSAVTKTSLGLGNVDNTSDVNKPVSTAQQTALNAKITLVTAPASASAAGTAGQVAYASGFFYVCVATNTWQRATLVTW